MSQTLSFRDAGGNVKKALPWFLWIATNVQASSFQEYCSNGAATVKIARGHIENEVSVTQRVKKEWSFVNQKVILPSPLILVKEVKQLEEHRDTVCTGEWGVFYWRDVFYKRIQILQEDGSLFAPNTLGVSKDKRFVEASVICEEQGNSEVNCDDPGQSEPK
jgi:hypothetical protein